MYEQEVVCVCVCVCVCACGEQRKRTHTHTHTVFAMPQQPSYNTRCLIIIIIIINKTYVKHIIYMILYTYITITIVSCRICDIHTHTQEFKSYQVFDLSAFPVHQSV